MVQMYTLDNCLSVHWPFATNKNMMLCVRACLRVLHFHHSEWIVFFLFLFLWPFLIIRIRMFNCTFVSLFRLLLLLLSIIIIVVVIIVLVILPSENKILLYFHIIFISFHFVCARNTIVLCSFYSSNHTLDFWGCLLSLLHQNAT